jgi:hypothetical protein
MYGHAMSARSTQPLPEEMHDYTANLKYITVQTCRHVMGMSDPSLDYWEFGWPGLDLS